MITYKPNLVLYFSYRGGSETVYLPKACDYEFTVEGDVSYQISALSNLKVQVPLNPNKKLTIAKITGVKDDLTVVIYINGKANNCDFYYGTGNKIPTTLEEEFRHLHIEDEISIELNPKNSSCYWIAFPKEFSIINWINTLQDLDIKEIFNTCDSYNHTDLGDYILYYHTSPRLKTAIGDVTYKIILKQNDAIR